jgi:hypothetical protein
MNTLVVLDLKMLFYIARLETLPHIQVCLSVCSN